MQKQQKSGHHVELQNDILQSMGSQISDLELSLSKISIKNKQLQEQVCKQKTKNCFNGHPMRYMYTKTSKLFHNEAKQASITLCDACDESVCNNTNVFWTCSKCDFDLCRFCAGYKRTVCVFNHPLEYRQKYERKMKCDICHTSGIKSGWHCECDFDVCDACYSK